MISFAGVGLVSTIIDVASLNYLRHAGVNFHIATGVSFILGATNGYLMNSAWVFDKGRSVRRYSKYFLASFIGLLLTEIIMDSAHFRGNLGLNESKAIAVAIVFFWNYSLSRFWTFR
jgi:putative flippase GtrA